MTARTTHVELKTEGSQKRTAHQLSMFAPMGDPLCFDVLSIVCWSLALSAILIKKYDIKEFQRSTVMLVKKHAADVSRKNLRVFGDDVAVSREYTSVVCDGLEAANLKVNRDKTFSAGSFRESCGMDAFKGVDVTPMRQRTSLEEPDVIALIALHNNMVRTAGTRLHRSVQLVREVIRRQYKYKVPLTHNCVKEPTCLQRLPGEHVISTNLHNCKWWFDTSLGELRLVFKSPEPARNHYPCSSDPRWDLNMWFFRKEQQHVFRQTAFERSVTIEGSPLTEEADEMLLKSIPVSVRKALSKLLPC
jgi:hypothetical protein